MSEKFCKWCEETRPLSDFYKGRHMADGHLNKCRFCCAAYSRKHRADNLEHYQEYDRQRADLPHRVACRKQHAERLRSTKEGRRYTAQMKKRWRDKNPQKRAAHIAVGNAVRDGALIPEPCSRCGEKKAAAHHEDYSKPLEVVWLCAPCHAERHREINSARRERQYA